MPPARRPLTKSTPTEPLPVGLTDTALSELGVSVGDAVRFRRRDTERWKEATVAKREADGSISVRDARGGLRALPIESIEVRTVGPRGGIVWEPLSERASRTEQMRLI